MPRPSPGWRVCERRLWTGAHLPGSDAVSGPLFLSILMLAAGALAWGGVVQVRRRERRGWLMLVAALVLVGNVLIWTA